MITWMTRASFIDTANDLDSALLMQTVEAVGEILEDMSSESGTADPAARGWIHNETGLAVYAGACAVVLVSRGFSMTGRVLWLAQQTWDPFTGHPAWIEDHDVLRSHRSNLVRRMPERYASVFPGQKPDWPYLWPVASADGSYDLVISKTDKKRLADGSRSLPKSTKARISNL